MISQALFLLALHALGTTFALWLAAGRLSPHETKPLAVPVSFLTISGLLWGALLWVFASAALLLLNLPYTPLSIGALLLLLWLFLAWDLSRRRPALTAADWRWLVVGHAVAAALYALASGLNLTRVSPDSLVMILNGRAFTGGWYSPFFDAELALRGVFLPLLQSASVFLGVDYLSGLQPAFSLVFAGLFFFFSRRALQALLPGRRSPLWMILLAFAALGSAHSIPFQSFLIHNNLLSGIYFFTALAAGWLYLQEQNRAWLVFTLLALTAFGLLRTESPLFALVFLALLFSEKAFDARAWVGLPFAAFFAAWYLYLLARMGEGTFILDPYRTLLVIASMAAFAVFVLLSRLRQVETHLLPRLPVVLLAVALLACAALLISDPVRMQAFLAALLHNMAISGLWGAGWFLIAAGLLLSAALPSIPYSRIFPWGIPIFLLMLYLVSTQNANYQLDWGDSANRMLTHIYPTAFFYLLVVFAQAAVSPLALEQLRSRRQPLLVALGTGLLVFGFATLLAR